MGGSIKKKEISVIICTHNPRKDYLEKVILSLRNQFLPTKYWEIVLIDNASSPAIVLGTELSWHSDVRLIYEEKVGLTQARLAGIQESKGELIVFVDDDNVLEPSYLKIAYQIGKEYPSLGAWGGQTLPCFETQPPDWTRVCWEYLGIRTFNTDRRTKEPNMSATPIGAGICIRRSVAKQYSESAIKNHARLSLGRSGTNLYGHEDIDLAYASFDLDLEVGIFKDLKLTHLMPSNRLKPDYLFRLAEGTGYSETWIAFQRGFLPSMRTFRGKLRITFPWLLNPKTYFLNPNMRKFFYHNTQGRVKAMREIAVLERSKLS